MDGLSVALGSGLNCVIGGRGTGKTTLLELVRWALGRVEPEHRKRVSRLVEANLSGGRVEVDIETADGIAYTVRRSRKQEPVVLSEDGTILDIDIKRRTLFSAEIYSQGEIERIANNPAFQLKLIDRFVSAEIARIESEIRACIKEAEANADVLGETENRIEVEKQKVAELPEILDRLSAMEIEESDSFAAMLKSEVEASGLRQREMRASAALQETFNTANASIMQVVRQFRSDISGIGWSAVVDGRNGAEWTTTQAAVETSARVIESHLLQAAAAATDGASMVQGARSDLRGLHQEQEAAYQDLVTQNQSHREQTTARDALVKKRVLLEEKKAVVVQLQERARMLEAERNQLLHRLSELRDGRFRVRNSVVEHLNATLAPTIRVSLEQQGETSKYKEWLTTAMRGSGLQYRTIVARMVDRLPPRELSELIRASDHSGLANALDIDDARAGKCLLQLADHARHVELAPVDDRPKIELKDGVDYKAAHSLSTGQKCTTILPILLMQSVNPLVVDQPEDNLDNAFIYEVVVAAIRAASTRRQLLFATHNPNIPVLGDAETVLVLQSTGRLASLAAGGTVDEVKDHIETILEGGREAFMRRKERYGY